MDSISRGLAREWKYQADDLAIGVALCFYTTFMVTINIVAKTDSNLFPEGFDISSLTEADRQERIYGSKLILVLENCQNATIWLTKVAILILYLRLTTLRWQHNAIRVLLGVVILLYFIMTSLYLGVWCRPFSQYWAIPPYSSQCNAATNHLITNATFNLTTDVIMLAITAPIFLRMHLPWRKKIPLVGVFSLGIFVVLAAILNKVYSFTQPFGSMWPYWYVRESSTALLVANLPFIWGLLRKVVGLKASSADSESNTRRDTIITAGDEGKRKQSTHNPMEFITEWPGLDDKDDVELEGEFRQFASGRAGRDLSLAEFLREDSDSDERRTTGEKSDATGPAVLQNTPQRDTLRRTSDPETRRSRRSTPPSSSLPSSMAGSWSANSFV